MARHNCLCKRKQQILEDSFLATAIPITLTFHCSHAIWYVLPFLALPLIFTKTIFIQEIEYYV